MVHITRIPRRDRAGTTQISIVEAKWSRLPVTAARVDQLRIGCNEFLDFIKHRQPRGGMDGDYGGSLDMPAF